MKQIVYITLVLFALGCDKDKFETKPQIKIESVKPEVLPRGADMFITLSFTDKEGDLAEGSVWVQKQIQNLRPFPDSKVDTFRFAIGEFPVNPKGEIQVALPWNILQEHPQENDTLRIRLVVKDKKGNTSDTATTGHVVILR